VLRVQARTHVCAKCIYRATSLIKNKGKVKGTDFGVGLDRGIVGVVHLGRSTCHTTRGRGDESSRILDD